MRRYFLLPLVCIALVQFAPAQELETIVAIGEAWECTLADLAAMVPAIVSGADDDTGGEDRLAIELGRYDPGVKLTKAKAAIIVARSLKIKTSLLFLVLPIRRYAFRAMVVDGVFGSTSSGGDVMSGVELLDFVSITGQKYVTNK